jgi:hypothetical protein
LGGLYRKHIQGCIKLTKLNWREEKDYNFTEKLSNLGWAWEFLRRSPEYKKMYGDYIKLMHEHSEIKPFFTPERSSEIQFKLDANKPVLSKGQELGKKWLLKDMYDPTKEFHDGGITFIYDIPNPAKIYNNTDIENYCDPKEIKIFEEGTKFSVIEVNEPVSIQDDLSVWVFDLKYDLADQFKLLKKQVEKEQENFDVTKSANLQGQKGNNVWLRHIRCLDAHLDDVSDADIAKGLNLDGYGGDKSSGSAGDDIVNYALRMANTGYKFIVIKALRKAQ